ncbi:recombinase family protein [Sinomicrobium weinanense]|uniref:Recombinase family protein n=1 Tax=Sinomicrobium weinanense TaxID=2842200 RepID=A0A926JPE4_9FLAO|nr:recombinase family protein [Sinomicrobium weinanense]MBC9794956.1 recombinase family protein [Sinomicrobium weinanense]MBU3125183.1 recombinase family protein [Sinomicrobium weinanense]
MYAKEGPYLSSVPPYGYRKAGECKERILVVEDREAKIVRFIFDAYLRKIPLYIIREKACKIGFQRKGNTAIQRILKNPAYAGLLKVKPFKNYPGGLFPGAHEPIIDRVTWHEVQTKMKKPKKTRTKIDDNIPLRGILKCHCGKPLTGAASRGKSGRYYYYYKCASPGHNNISAIKAYHQFLGICEFMSLTKRKIQQIKEKCHLRMESLIKRNRKVVKTKKQQLEQVKEKLYSVEEKWIKNEIKKDTYNRWYTTYNHNILELGDAIKRLSQNKIFDLLTKNLDFPGDVRHIYASINTIKKRVFVSMVFHNNLYYQNDIYRTPTMMELFTHNHSKMKEKRLLVYEKKTAFRKNVPLCENTEISIERLILFLMFLDSLKIS